MAGEFVSRIDDESGREEPGFAPLRAWRSAHGKAERRKKQKVCAEKADSQVTTT